MILRRLQLLQRTSFVILGGPILKVICLLAIAVPLHGNAAGLRDAGTPPKAASGQTPVPDGSPTQPGSQSVTQLLSPTALNIFNFGAHRFKVQYPPNGPVFSGVYMTVTAVPISQAAYYKRLSGTPFANALCIIYDGAAGNCIDYQVTCATVSGQVIPCPASSAPNIQFWSSYDTEQPIVNPGLLTSPIGANSWQNVMDTFFLTRIDPTTHGHTKGWSEFVSVALGATNPQGLGTFAFNSPLQPLDPKVFPVNQPIPVSFQLSSVANCNRPVTDAVASLTVLKVADALGHPLSQFVYYRLNAFKYSSAGYEYTLPTNSFAPGTYVLTVYGNAFVSTETYFTIQ